MTLTRKESSTYIFVRGPRKASVRVQPRTSNPELRQARLHRLTNGGTLHFQCWHQRCKLKLKPAGEIVTPLHLIPFENLFSQKVLLYDGSIRPSSGGVGTLCSCRALFATLNDISDIASAANEGRIICRLMIICQRCSGLPPSPPLAGFSEQIGSRAAAWRPCNLGDPSHVFSILLSSQ